MSGLKYCKIMHLISEDDFQLFKQLKDDKSNHELPSKSDSTIPEEVMVKNHNEDLLISKKESDFKENVEWEKFGAKMGPILNPPDKKIDSETVITDIIRFLPDNVRKKGRLLLEALKKEKDIKLDSKSIYINGNLVDGNITDIIDSLVRPRKKLQINLNDFLSFLGKIKFPRSLIHNVEALQKINSEDPKIISPSLSPVKNSSTPKGKKGKRKKLAKSLLSTDSNESIYEVAQNGRGKIAKWYNF